MLNIFICYVKYFLRIMLSIMSSILDKNNNILTKGDKSVIIQGRRSWQSA